MLRHVKNMLRHVVKTDCKNHFSWISNQTVITNSLHKMAYCQGWEQRGVRGRDWEKRREDKLWPGCKINK